MNFRPKINLTINSSWFRVAMRTKHKQSEIQKVKRNSTSTSSNNCQKLKFIIKILPVHHDCNNNDQNNSHKLLIQTAFLKNRKMNFRLKIKLTVNSSWFWVAMRAKHKHSEVRLAKRNSISARSNNCFHWWREICFLK